MQWIADRIQDFTEADRQNSIGRTDRFVAGASSDISEEMMELSFLECFQITIFLRYSFVTTSSVSASFFFFQIAVQKRGVHYTHSHIIHR